MGDENENTGFWNRANSFADSNQATLGAVNSALGGYAAMQQGDTAMMFAQNNAAIDRRNAKQVLKDADRRSTLELEAGESSASSITAGAAARGISQEGSATALKIQTLLNSKLNALEVRRVSRVEAVRLENAASLSDLRGQLAQSKGRIEALRFVSQGVNQFA